MNNVEHRQIEQTTVLNYLLANPETLRTHEVNPEWFDTIKEKMLVDILISNDGEYMQNDEILRRLSERDSNQLYTLGTLAYAKNQGERKVTKLDFEKKLTNIERDNKEKWVAISVNELHRAMEMNFPKEKINEKMDIMKDRLRELEQVGQVGNDGKLDDAIDRMKYKLKNDVPLGIKSFFNLDFMLGGGIQKGEFILIGALTGVGKGNTNSTDMPTPKGNVKMGELKVNDYVFDRYGKPTKVTGVYPRGKLKTYKVTLTDGRSTVVDGDHIWSYFSMSGSGNESLIDKKTSEMFDIGTHTTNVDKNGSVHKHARYKIPTNGVVEFEKKDNLIEPYVIGALIGDGCLLERRLTMSSNDSFVTEKVAEMIGMEATPTTHNNFSWNFKLIKQIKNKKYIQTKELLTSLPELQNYSHNKQIPQSYLFTDSSSRMQLLNGLFDTDGHAYICKNRLNVGYTTTSKKLAEQVRWLLQSCGYLSGLTVDSREGRRDCYNISVLDQAEKTSDLFTLKIKKDVVDSFKRIKKRKYDRISIKSIEETGILEEVTCISVENEEQLYLCNDFIVTHNTTFAMNAALEMLERNPDMNVDFFSLEMTQDQMLEKLLSTITQIPSQNFRNPNYQLEEKQKEKAELALEAMRDGRFRVFDAERNIDAISRLITRRAYECKDENYICIVDYIGLAKSSSNSKEQTATVEEMSRTLKSLTIKLNIPIIALSQFSRGISNRDNKKPQLSDLKDSSSLEQDANIVIFLWNPDIDLNGEDYKNFEMITECVIAKSRAGMTGDIYFRFLKTKSTFIPEKYTAEQLKEMGL